MTIYERVAIYTLLKGAAGLRPHVVIEGDKPGSVVAKLSTVALADMFSAYAEEVEALRPRLKTLDVKLRRLEK